MLQVVRAELGKEFFWTMDELFPVFVFVVVRSCILQLGSEIHFVEDFMESRLANGDLVFMFTTLKVKVERYEDSKQLSGNVQRQFSRIIKQSREVRKLSSL